jgi:ribosomal-protein-alanine N-acetyltransferase
LILQGNTIHLKPLSINEVNTTYLSWLQDPEVMTGIETSGYTLENLKQYVTVQLGNSNVHFFAIWSNDTNQHIGNIKFEIVDRKAKVSDLGLLIGNKNYWGKGVGSEACKLGITYLFEQLGLRKIYLAVYENNPSAKKLYENAGFKLEGTLRKHVLVNNEYYDKYLMGLFKEEFTK